MFKLVAVMLLASGASDVRYLGTYEDKVACLEAAAAWNEPVEDAYLDKSIHAECRDKDGKVVTW